MNELTLSIAPHIHSERTTQKVMLDVIIALAPSVVAAVILYGFRSLLLTVISAGVCVLLEYGYEKLMRREITISDLSAIVTGILLALNVPASMPIWQLIVGDAAAILMAKMLFGGIGRNFMNPALVGRIVLMFSFTGNMTAFSYPNNVADALSTATPLPLMDRLTWANFGQLFLGVHGGVIGETCILAVLIGGVYLVVRGVIKPIIPLCYMGSVIVFTFLFGGPHPVLSIFAGGVAFGAVFMATDYTTSPFTNWGKVIFGVGCGLINTAIRVWGNYAEGVTFAILLMNLLVPYINDWTRTKPLGGQST